MIPAFDECGNLPPGIHRATWTEIVARYATSIHRRDLLDDERAAQKARYGGEIFPAQWPAHQDGTTFRDYFQYDNVTKRPKGIIVIDLAGLP
jgi:Family of unknown function (DUF6932)